jgi:hypothetical protein
MSKRLRPETVAVTLAEHAHDTEPEPQTFLARVVAELFEAEPGVREHISDLFFVELTEELHRRGEGDAVRAVLEVQNHWVREV